MKNMLWLFMIIHAVFLSFNHQHVIEEKSFVFNQLSEFDITYNHLATTIQFEYETINDYHLDVKQVIIKTNVYYQDAFQRQLDIVIPIDVKHHSALRDIEKQTFSSLYFDEIEVTSIEIVNATFIESYSNTLSFSITYAVIILVLWFIGDRFKHLILSEVHTILAEYWWAALILGLFIPALFSFLTYVGRYHVLTTVYGWIFLFTAMISLAIAYMIVFLFHFIKERIH